MPYKQPLEDDLAEGEKEKENEERQGEKKNNGVKEIIYLKVFNLLISIRPWLVAERKSRALNLTSFQDNYHDNYLDPIVS